MKRADLQTYPKKAIYASNPSKSLGRTYATNNSPTRSEFQRDRDRIIHSTAFRRLQHKTQVFLHHEGTHYRTRLTHTLEVSQIARSIARALAVNEDLAEAIALAHDLGHPPFGHAGERVLNEGMKQWGGFDHNLQALRTVIKLENHYAQHDGLNLTWEALEGILKHNGPITNITDSEKINLIKGLEYKTHAGLEAQIAAIADDIAYNSHDIDDALRANIISIEQLCDVPMVGDIAKQVLKEYPKIEQNRQAHEVQRRLITQTIENVIVTSNQLIAELDPQNVADIRHSECTLICFSNEFAKQEKLLKKFMLEKVYNSQTVAKPVKQAEKMLAKLFDRLLEKPTLPKNWQVKYEKANGKAKQARVICDYIAGMTDPYTIELYQTLFDESPNFS